MTLTSIPNHNLIVNHTGLIFHVVSFRKKIQFKSIIYLPFRILRVTNNIHIFRTGVKARSSNATEISARVALW